MGNEQSASQEEEEKNEETTETTGGETSACPPSSTCCKDLMGNVDNNNCPATVQESCNTDFSTGCPNGCGQCGNAPPQPLVLKVLEDVVEVVADALGFTNEESERAPFDVFFGNMQIQLDTDFDWYMKEGQEVYYAPTGCVVSKTDFSNIGNDNFKGSSWERKFIPEYVYYNFNTWSKTDCNDTFQCVTAMIPGLYSEGYPDLKLSEEECKSYGLSRLDNTYGVDEKGNTRYFRNSSGRMVREMEMVGPNPNSHGHKWGGSGPREYLKVINKIKCGSNNFCVSIDIDEDENSMIATCYGNKSACLLGLDCTTDSDCLKYYKSEYSLPFDKNNKAYEKFSQPINAMGEGQNMLRTVDCAGDEGWRKDTCEIFQNELKEVAKNMVGETSTSLSISNMISGSISAAQQGVWSTLTSTNDAVDGPPKGCYYNAARDRVYYNTSVRDMKDTKYPEASLKWHEPCTFQNQCVSYTQGLSRILNEVEIVDKGEWPHAQSQTGFGFTPHLCLEIAKKNKKLKVGIPFINRYVDTPYGCLITDDGVIFNAANYNYWNIDDANDPPYNEMTCDADNEDALCLFRNQKLNWLPPHIAFPRQFYIPSCPSSSTCCKDVFGNVDKKNCPAGVQVLCMTDWATGCPNGCAPCQ